MFNENMYSVVEKIHVQLNSMDHSMYQKVQSIQDKSVDCRLTSIFSWKKLMCNERVVRPVVKLGEKIVALSLNDISANIMSIPTYPSGMLDGVKGTLELRRPQEAAKNNNGKSAHSSWRNYDDFNEYFWSPCCFEIGWPMRKNSPFLLKPRKSKRGLSIIAFHKGTINLDTFKVLLSIGPAFSILNLLKSIAVQSIFLFIYFFSL